MHKKQRMLFLKMTNDYDEILPHIENVATIYGISTTVFEFDTLGNLSEFLSQAEQFDYLYVAAHGNPSGIAAGPNNFIRWADFAAEICNSPGLRDNSVIYLGCCFGGLKRGALVMLHLCPTIHHVCGSQCEIDSRDALLAFHTFVSHHCKGMESETIKCAVATAIGKGFDIFSRYNMDLEIAQVASHFIMEYPCLDECFFPTPFESLDRSSSNSVNDVVAEVTA